MTTTRGTSNADDRGSAEARRQRKRWLFEVWAADVVHLSNEQIERLDVIEGGPSAWVQWDAQSSLWILPIDKAPAGVGAALVRCFRCGHLLTWETVEVDRIKPGCEGGRYTRNNIRPCCPKDNTYLGELAKQRKREKRERRNAAERERRKRKKKEKKVRDWIFDQEYDAVEDVGF